MASLMNDLHQVLASILTTAETLASSEVSSSIWNAVRKLVDPKLLGSFLHHICKVAEHCLGVTTLTCDLQSGTQKFQKNAEEGKSDLDLAHLSAALYLCLMRIPGSRSNFYNEFAMHCMLKSLMLGAEPCNEKQEKKKTTRKRRAVAMDESLDEHVESIT